MPKRPPGLFDSFKGLWARGPVDKTPPDHFSDCLNIDSLDCEIESRAGSGQYLVQANIVRMAVFKPNPPFDASNYPRIIYLKSNGDLFDSKFTGTPIFSNASMLDFSLVNFFGRCYISPSDGRVGLNGQVVKVYDGTGSTGFRNAAGVSPTTGALTANLTLGSGGGLQVGTYLLSYAFETASGFVTQPATPFVAIDAVGGASINITILPTGPAGTVARWIIVTQAIPLRANLGIAFDVAKAPFFPQFFAVRVPNNIATTYNPLTFFDEALVDSADYLQTQLTTIPAGVGLMEYKGRMVSYGEYGNSTLARVSEIGEPEAFSATSGFLITDPTDSSGVRSAVEFRGNLYLYKDSRGYVTQDNKQEASTWDVIDFEKAVGTEHYGIGAILDAKGSSTEGFLIASRGALDYFNGTIMQPEMSYKIRDLWLRINKPNFHKVQVAQDPINKRIYIIVPLDSSVTPSHIIVGDYREGLSPISIKWYLWQFNNPATCIIIYEEFVSNIFNYAVRIGNSVSIDDVAIGSHGTDAGANINSFFETAPVRFSSGISVFNYLKIRALGPTNTALTLYGEDRQIVQALEALIIPTVTPGREYAILANLVSEQAVLRMQAACNNTNVLQVNAFQIVGQHLWDERPS